MHYCCWKTYVIIHIVIWDSYDFSEDYCNWHLESFTVFLFCAHLSDHTLISTPAAEKVCTTQVRMVLPIRTREVVQACHFLLASCSFPFVLHFKSEPGCFCLVLIPFSELPIYLFFPSHLLSSPPHCPWSLFFLLTAAGLGHSVWALSISPLWGFIHLLFSSVSFPSVCLLDLIQLFLTPSPPVLPFCSIAYP